MIVSLIAASAVGLEFQLLHIVRAEPRDWIYYDAGFFVFGAVNFYTWWIVARPSREGMVMLGLVAAIVFFDNLRAGATMRGYLPVNYHMYGWQRLAFFDFSWPDEKGYFSVKSMIAGRYGKIDAGTAGLIVDHAGRHKKVLHDARFVMANQTVTTGQIGMAAIGQGVWSVEKDWRIHVIPKIFVGATIVDVRMGTIDPDMPKWRLGIADEVRSLRIDKGAVGWNLAVLGRQDLGVYVFVPETLLTGFDVPRSASMTDHIIELAGPEGRKMSLRGVWVNEYALFPWETAQRAFVLIASDSQDRSVVH